MKNMRRCVACGRRRKPGHERRVGKENAYSPQCLTDEVYRSQRGKIEEATSTPEPVTGE